MACHGVALIEVQWSTRFLQTKTVGGSAPGLETELSLIQPGEANARTSMLSCYQVTGCGSGVRVPRLHWTVNLGIMSNGQILVRSTVPAYLPGYEQYGVWVLS